MNDLFSDNGIKRFEYNRLNTNNLQEEKMVFDLDTFMAQRVLPKMCIAAKKNDLLTEIFKEYYDDEDKRNRLIKTLKKFNLYGDKATRKVVLDLFNNLEKLTLERKEQIINHYDEIYLSDERIRKVIDEFINENKKVIIETIKEAYFIEQH